MTLDLDTIDLGFVAPLVFGEFAAFLTPKPGTPNPPCFSSITYDRSKLSGTFTGSPNDQFFFISDDGCSLSGEVNKLYPYDTMLGDLSCGAGGGLATGHFLIGCNPIIGDRCVNFGSTSGSQTQIGSVTVLPDGRVVIIAGTGDGKKVPGAIELYTPATRGFTSSKATMLRARTGHTATLLTTGPQAGKILIAGGEDRQDRTSLASTELYDPVADAATCIDGSQPSGSPASCPSSTKMIDARVGHSATLLGSGKVLLVGGLSTAAGVGGLPTVSTLATAELYDPVTERFTCVDGSAPTGDPPACPSAGNLAHPRAGHTATVLKNGQVLLAGGLDLDLSTATAQTLGAAEIFDPVSGHFLPTAANMISARMGQSATLLENGQVLLAGGMSGTANLPDVSFTTLNSAEIYDPASDTFTATGDLHTARVLHAAALRRDGKVILGGGWDGTIKLASGMAGHHPVNGRTLQSIEIFHPSTGSFSRGGKMSIPGGHQSLIGLPPDSFPTQTE
jgi:WD40 repeat protein